MATINLTDVLLGEDAPTIETVVTNAGFIKDSVSDNTPYVRQDGAWIAMPDTGIPDAPNDGESYVRQSLGWAVIDDPAYFLSTGVPPVTPSGAGEGTTARVDSNTPYGWAQRFEVVDGSMLRQPNTASGGYSPVEAHGEVGDTYIQQVPNGFIVPLEFVADDFGTLPNEVGAYYVNVGTWTYQGAAPLQGTATPDLNANLSNVQLVIYIGAQNGTPLSGFVFHVREDVHNKYNYLDITVNGFTLTLTKDTNYQFESDVIFGQSIGVYEITPGLSAATDQFLADVGTTITSPTSTITMLMPQILAPYLVTRWDNTSNGWQQTRIGDAGGSLSRVSDDGTSYGYRLAQTYTQGLGPIGHSSVDLGYYYGSPIGVRGPTGDRAFCTGVDNYAQKEYSTAMGYNNNVDGQYSAAIGHVNVITSQSSTALGYQNTINNNYSAAIGNGNTIEDNGIHCHKLLRSV